MHTIQTTHNNASHTLTNTMDRGTAHSNKTNLVSEIIYDPQNPFTLHLLLPFLQQLSQQPRWQLWFSPERRLNRYWINSLGLPAEKTFVLKTASDEMTIDMIEKALRSGNFSSIVAWIPSVNHDIKEKLHQAAMEGDCYCFLLQPILTGYYNPSHNNMYSKTHWH